MGITTMGVTLMGVIGAKDGQIVTNGSTLIITKSGDVILRWSQR